MIIFTGIKMSLEISRPCSFTPSRWTGWSVETFYADWNSTSNEETSTSVIACYRPIVTSTEWLLKSYHQLDAHPIRGRWNTFDLSNNPAEYLEKKNKWRARQEIPLRPFAKSSRRNLCSSPTHDDAIHQSIWRFLWIRFLSPWCYFFARRRRDVRKSNKLRGVFLTCLEDSYRSQHATAWSTITSIDNLSGKRWPPEISRGRWHAGNTTTKLWDP